jgi:regulator of protease activity HflC (stomatin/prohibitin superfamily)
MNIRNIGRTLAIALIAISAAACTRIETGEVGLRITYDKQIEMQEIPAGKMPQTLVGDVLTFPVRDIGGSLEDKRPLTKDDVALKQVDLSYVYSVSPTAVAELWTKQPRSFHLMNEKQGDTYLMAVRMNTLVNNALYESVRKYSTKEVNDKRQAIEQDVTDIVARTLKNDKLEGVLTLTSVQVRAIDIPDSIRDSAAAVVRSQNELAVAATQVEIAKKEAERMAALASNSGQSIAYMDAQARLNISEAVKAGKVSTIVIPHDFKGIVNVK